MCACLALPPIHPKTIPTGHKYASARKRERERRRKKSENATMKMSSISSIRVAGSSRAYRQILLAELEWRIWSTRCFC